MPLSPTPPKGRSGTLRCATVSLTQAPTMNAQASVLYIVLGLLYGQKDMDQTIIIATRCGQDSDCNPANAAGILGTVLGRSQLDRKFTDALKTDIKFSHTPYTFPALIAVCEKLTRQAVVRSGGKIETDAQGNAVLFIPPQAPTVGPLEQSWEPGPPTNSRFTESEMKQIKTQ